MGWWVGSAKSGREFEVRDAISELGAFAWVAREFRVVRPPKTHKFVPSVRPLLIRYVFIECDDATWHEVREVKHLASTLLAVPASSARCHLRPFMERVDADFRDREARHAAGERLDAYQPGDLLRVLAGPLADQLVRFEAVVAGASDLEDKLRARMDLLGGAVPVTLDPLHVVKVAAE